MNYPYNNPPMNLWDKNNFSQPQQQNNFQPLQSIQNAKPPMRVACYTVSNKDEMSNIEPQLNVIYVGINTSAKEIYTKQLNNNGLVDSYVYTQFSNESKEAKDDFKAIINRLEQIEQKLGGQNVNNSKSNATSFGGSVPQQPNDGTIQPTYARQERVATNADTNQPRQVQGY